MSVADRIRRLLRGHGPAGPMLEAAEDAGLRITPDGPVPASCGSSAHDGDPAPAEITGWKVGPALIPTNGGPRRPRRPRTAYCLRCSALAYIGGAFMPDAPLMATVLAELVRIAGRARVAR